MYKKSYYLGTPAASDSGCGTSVNVGILLYMVMTPLTHYCQDGVCSYMLYPL